jgi:hypothetical protein
LPPYVLYHANVNVLLTLAEGGTPRFVLYLAAFPSMIAARTHKTMASAGGTKSQPPTCAGGYCSNQIATVKTGMSATSL